MSEISKLFEVKLSDEELGAMSSLALAHIGDGVYELLVRTMLCTDGRITAPALHRETVRRVSAEAQSEAVLRIRPLLTEQEEDVFRRARNTKVNTVPKHADISQYHAATGLEALFGWLYLHGEGERIRELFNVIMEKNNAT